MRRRDFVISAVALAASSRAAWGQPAAVRRVGVIMGVAEADRAAPQRIAGLRQQFGKLGWFEGRNLDLEIRWSASKIDLATSQAKELVAWGPDVLIAHTLMPALALRKATTKIPIVFTNVSDPNGAGLVESVSHPGGNITGFSNLAPTIGAKWLQLLREIDPRIKRAASIYDPEASPVAAAFATVTSEAGPGLSIVVSKLEVSRVEELESAISRFSEEPGSALLFPPDIFTATHRDIIISLAARYKIPTIYPYRFFVDDGGLISYGTNAVDSFAQAATYVDRILHGAKPADLPVQSPTKYELVVNLKAAKAMGLSIPPNVLDLADDVVQ